ILGVTGTLELVIPLGARLGHPKWRQAMKEAGVSEPMIEDAVKRISESYVGWQENSFPGLLGNVVAGRVANRLDLGGTNCVVDAACASSLSALHLAGMELQTGRADVVVTGGVDTFNDILVYMCFSKTPALLPTASAGRLEAHGPGTRGGDAAEVRGLPEGFAEANRRRQPRGDARPWCALGSVKSQIGHTKAAAGAAGLIKAALALYHKVLPP